MNNSNWSVRSSPTITVIGRTHTSHGLQARAGRSACKFKQRRESGKDVPGSNLPAHESVRRERGRKNASPNQYISSAPCATSAIVNAPLPTVRSECAMTPCGGAPASRAKLSALGRIASCERSAPHSTPMSAPLMLSKGRVGARGRRCGCG